MSDLTSIDGQVACAVSGYLAPSPDFRLDATGGAMQPGELLVVAQFDVEAALRRHMAR